MNTTTYPRIERVPIASLTPAAYNPRQIGDERLNQLTRSLSELGTLQPITVNARTGNVVGGHQRMKSYAAMGHAEVDVWLVDLPPDKEKAANLALNNLSGEWNADLLRPLLAELESADLLELAGFDPAALEEYMTPAEPPQSDLDADAQIDKAEELRAQWGVELGQVWQLGEHRIACGDSTRQSVADNLMRGDKADMVLTDPPYGVAYVGKTADALTIENDDLDETELAALVSASFDVAQSVCRGGAYWYATVPPGPLHLIFADDWKRRGILRQIMVWAKDAMVLGHSEYHYQHEPILFGWMKGDRHKNSDRTRTTLWECARPKQSKEHPTMKPVELWERAIRDGSRPGEVVYEPFSGSGTTIIACERTGRKCRAIELNPGYVAVAIQRWADATGKEPRRL